MQQAKIIDEELMTKESEAAAGVAYEEENLIMLSEEQFSEMIKTAVKETVTELRRQESKESGKDKYHNTFFLMKRYRDIAFHVENAISDGYQLELAGMTEEQQRTYLESIRRSRFMSLICMAHIDKAIEEIARRRKEADREIEYKTFEAYFMDGKTYDEIAEELDTGKNTPRRWVTEIIKELSVLLWGADENAIK